MSRELAVYLRPDLFDPEDLRGGTAVVIDVLRASTTIVHALAAGAQTVIPCEGIEQARELAAKHTDGPVLLGGERHGKLIEGFDLDNSPLQYTSEAVHGKTVVFTTTNGTRALLRSKQAERIVLGGFVNINAVVQWLLNDDLPVHLVCAGTRGHITSEDCLFAGAVASSIWSAEGQPDLSDDPTRMVIDFYTLRSATRQTFLQALFDSRGGRNLNQAGFADDIRRAATWDMFDLVPEFNPETGQIQALPAFTGVKKRCIAEPIDP